MPLMTEIAVPQPSAFRVGDAIAFGWKRTWRNFWWLLLLSLLFTAVNGAIGLVTGVGDTSTLDPNATIEDQVAQATSLAFDGVGTIVQVLVSVFLALGVIRIALAVTAGDRVRIGLLWSFRGFGRYLLGSIVVGLIVLLAVGVLAGGGIALAVATDAAVFGVIGVALAILAAILVSLGFSLYGYAIIDRDARGLSSLAESWRLVKPRFAALFGLQVLIALVVIGTFVAAVVLGVLMLLVGLLVTLPAAGVISFGMGSLSMGYAYRTLGGQPVA